MADFKTYSKLILKVEGGYVNDPDDPGGETKFGISKRSYPKEDIKNMTPERALAIYKRDFWDAPGYGGINSEELAYKVFEMGVNVGSERASILLQEAINDLSLFNLTEDGVIGPKSLKAINSMNEELLLERFKERCKGYYTSLVSVSPKKRKYLKGWLNRVNAGFE